MPKLEKDIERKLTAMVKRHGGRCEKLINVSFAGFPDRTVLLPGEVVLFVETKRPKGGRLEARQRKWQKWLTEFGFFAGVAWTLEDVAAIETVIIERLRR